MHKKVVAMVKIQDYEILLEACSQAGCLLCRLTYQHTTRYLETWKYELFTNVELRAQLRHTHGFCHTHTWQLVHMGATLQLAQTYQEIISDTIDELQQKNNPALSPRGTLRRLLSNTQNRSQATNNQCPACLRQSQAEERYADSLRQIILDDTFYAHFLDSTGLCLRHFKFTSEMKTPESAGPWLDRMRTAQLHCLQNLNKQLGELIRKHDYRFQYEQRGEEMYSWITAAGIIASENEQQGPHKGPQEEQQ